ncbi:MAG: hypothetical protein PHE83_05880 [Opitutaceae bacterium]|nr:hypothetical protein [Opitutaceae bacterium]
MRITYSTTLICSDQVALGRLGAGASWQGQPIIDAAQFFRAAVATVYGRGDGPEEFSLRVWALFATVAAALHFCGTHRASLPVQADLILVDEGGTIQLRMADAVRSVRIVERRGLAVLVDYNFTGSKFASEDVSAEPDPTDLMKVGILDLTGGDESKAVVFDVPFASSPRAVHVTVLAPAGGFVIGAGVDESTRTTAGFTARFGAAIPATGYKLSWTAIL